MDFEPFLSWFKENKEWLLALFSGGAFVIIGWISGFFRWVLGLVVKKPAPPPTVDQRVEQGRQNLQVGQASGDVHYHAGAQIDVNELVKTFLEAQSRQQDAAGIQIDELIQGHEETHQQIRQLTIAVNALAEQRSEPDAPPGIDAALEQLSRGETDSAEALFEEILERKKVEGEASLKEAAAAAQHIGALAYLHDTDKALSAYTQAVELDPDDPDGWNMLGNLRHRVGDLDGAEEACERVLALGNRASDESLLAIAYGGLGIINTVRGDLAKAEEFQLKSLSIVERLGRKEGMANTYGNLGIIYEKQGDLAKAEEYHLKSLAIDEEFGRKEGMASVYGNLGIIYGKQGDLAKAEEYHLKSLAIEEELGHKEGMASDYGNLGIIYEKQGDLAKAEEYHLKSLAIEEELGHKEGMASDYGNLGIIYEKQGDLAKAEEYHLKSLTIDEELGRKEAMASQYGNLGLVYEARGDLSKACGAWAKSRGLYIEVGASGSAEEVRGWMDEAGCSQEKAGTKDEEG
ncbi:MAG: tetratricopeptide repeat protein [Proteobacteria bacterium]|nr:tetratricopeptide repeat protein [Pseudomonadota bacterium]